MFNTNEYNFKLDPFRKPGIIVLDLTKKSKRNKRIRRFGSYALASGVIWFVGQVNEEFKRRQSLEENDTSDQS